MWILPLCSNLQGPPVPGKEGMAHAIPEAHGSKKNIYNCDGGFPLRIIIQQLQEEAKYLVYLLDHLQKPLLGTGNRFWCKAFPL